jgi:hypothetical protein
MILNHNRHRPGFDAGFRTTGMPRDGTERKPRDGTEGMPRDGTLRKPRDKTFEMTRDGTLRKPRDKTILWKGNFVNRQTGQQQDVRIHYRPSSRWRRPVRRKPAFGTGNGRGMPNREVRITKYEVRMKNIKK